MENTARAVKRDPDPIELSVVVPVHDEEGALEELHRRLVETLSGITASFEIVYVDDGSADGSLAKLRSFAGDASVRVLSLSRNFGHQAAMAAGLEHAAGSAVVTMDADLQDPPELIPSLVARWRSGEDVVLARRDSRAGESFARRLAIHAYYRLLQRVSDHPVALDVGDFRLLDRQVLDVVLSLPERQKYLRGLVSWAGFRHGVVPYHRPGRSSGRSKFTYRKLLGLALRGLTSSGNAPLYAIMPIGSGALTLGGLASVYAFATSRPWFLLVSAFVLLTGLQLAALGLVASYLGRVLDEVRARPSYLVAWDSRSDDGPRCGADASWS